MLLLWLLWIFVLFSDVQNLYYKFTNEVTKCCTFIIQLVCAVLKKNWGIWSTYKNNIYKKKLQQKIRLLKNIVSIRIKYWNCVMRIRFNLLEKHNNKMPPAFATVYSDVFSPTIGIFMIVALSWCFWVLISSIWSFNPSLWHFDVFLPFIQIFIDDNFCSCNMIELSKEIIGYTFSSVARMKLLSSVLKSHIPLLQSVLFEKLCSEWIRCTIGDIIWHKSL